MTDTCSIKDCNDKPVAAVMDDSAELLGLCRWHYNRVTKYPIQEVG